jgi:Heparinase II/III-like protein/Heparinase II/III N-terminus
VTAPARHASIERGADLTPRPVHCVIAHLHQDRCVADDACAGRFTELGLTLELGPEPDWLDGDFPADEEWRIAFGKFYVGLDLAATFGRSGDCRYQRAWERLVTSWMAQVPIGEESTDTVARRMLSWIYAWSAFAQSPWFEGLAPGRDALLADSLAAQADWLRKNLTAARNHRTLELYALFIHALALPELDAGGELLKFALCELGRNLESDFRADGVHVEASAHYHLIVLRSFVGVRVNARRFGIALPAGFDERLRAALEFAMHCHRPDGQVPALSDADSGSYAELLSLAAGELRRPDYLYVATSGALGTPPTARNVSFPAAGYHIQRSGWGDGDRHFEDERFLIFDCGPIGDGGHGHYDLLSVELAAGGRPLVLDPGRFTYHEGDPNMRHWFKGTRAHNTVCVDDLDQTEYHRGKPKGAIAQGRLIARSQVRGLDVLWGEATSPRYDARHSRRVVFVNGEYWVFEDRLSADRPHRYDLRWHLAPEACGRVEFSVGERIVRVPGLLLAFAPGSEIAIEEGWYAPRYGIRHAAPVVSAVIEGAADAVFITLVAPGLPNPTLAVIDLDETRATIEVSRGGAVDTISWSADGRSLGWRRSGGVMR